MISLDNAATTKRSKTATDAMLPYMDKVYGNPSCLHFVGQKANEALINARERLAKLLGCEAREQKGTAKHNEPLCIIFDEPQCVVTPGQPAVLYDGDQVSGDDVMK